MKHLLIAAAAAALAVPALAQVAPTAPVAPRAPMAMKMRTGPMADGVMTLAEVQAKVAQAFQKKDANRDGALTEDELGRKHPMRGARAGTAPAGVPNGVVPVRPKMDSNAMFDRMDANRDGVISRDEFAKGHDMRIARRVAMRGPDGARMKMRHPGMHGGMMGARMFGMADSNKDGRVTLGEAQATAAQHFAMADANRDGRVTADEMKAMHGRMGGMGHHG